MDNIDGGAPGWPFILGLQDKFIARKAIDNGWMVNSTYIDPPIVMLLTETLNARANIEPIPGLKIEINGLRSITNNQSAYLDRADAAAIYGIRNPMQTGNFSISFLAITSAFERPSSTNNFTSAAYNRFLTDRPVIAQRWGQIAQQYFGSTYNPNVDAYGNPITDGSTNGFGLTSQDVLIPAFMAGYSGKSPSSITLDKFPNYNQIMPNWKLTYDGLAKLPILQKYVRSIIITHQYKCSYNVGSYIATTDSLNIYTLDYLLSTLRDIQNNWQPKIDMQGVSIAEQFSPLIGIEVNLKNSLSTKFEWKTSRNVALSLANNQIIENNTQEFIIGAGYKITDVDFIVVSDAGKKGVRSSINLKADISIRNNVVVLRPIDQLPQASQGSDIFTLKLLADYIITKDFNISMFFNRIVNTPVVSSSYPTANTNVGVSLHFVMSK